MKNPDGITAIVRAMDYIEAHVEEPLTLDVISGQVGYSPYHFARMFSVTTGYTVMEHVRRRKLFHAAAALDGGESITDIAFRHGFQTHEGFTRSFVRQFKMSPSRYREKGPHTVPPIPYPIYRKGESKMDCKFVERQDTPVIGYMLHTSPQSAQIPAFWEAVMSDDRFERLMKKSRAMENFGICKPIDTQMEKMDYIIAFDYDGESPVDPDMVLSELAGGKYAVFRCPNMQSIRETWTHIYTQWMPASEYEFDSPRLDFELYLDGDTCEVYIPVREKRVG